MYEKQTFTEKEPVASNLELIVDQLRDITTTPELGLDRADDETPEAYCERVSKWARSTDLGSALTKIGYYEDEWTSASNDLLKVGLMTAHYINSNEKIDARAVNAREIVRQEAIVYNDNLREAIEANPTLGANNLANFLQGAVMLGDSSAAYTKKAEYQINSVINGARSELNFKRIANTPAMQEMGILYEDTSSDEDFDGMDCRVSVNIGKGNERIRVQFPVDVKSTPQQVSELSRSKEVKPYGIKGNSIVLWSGVSLQALGNNLLVDPAEAEAKTESMSKVLQFAAIDYYNMIRMGQMRIS